MVSGPVRVQSRRFRGPALAPGAKEIRQGRRAPLPLRHPTSQKNRPSPVPFRSLEKNPSEISHGSCYCSSFFPSERSQVRVAPYIYLDSLPKAARLLCSASVRQEKGGEETCLVTSLALGTLGLLLLIERRTVVVVFSRDVSSVVRSSEQ